MKIGILGGSFDPIHNGHVHMALAACKEFALDQVWLIPAGHSPNKEEKAMTDAEHRYRMCEIAPHAKLWLPGTWEWKSVEFPASQIWQQEFPKKSLTIKKCRKQQTA